MQKETRHEKRLREHGTPIITWEHDEISDYLVTIFNRDKDKLILQAASDNTRRRELAFIMDYPNCFTIGDTNFGGMVYYNKKRCEFTHISYGDKHNWLVIFSIKAPQCYYSAWEHHQTVKHIKPYPYPVKKLSIYLLNN